MEDLSTKEIEEQFEKLKNRPWNYYEEDEAYAIRNHLFEILKHTKEAFHIAADSHWDDLSSIGGDLMEYEEIIIKLMNRCVEFNEWAREQHVKDKERLDELKKKYDGLKAI